MGQSDLGRFWASFGFFLRLPGLLASFPKDPNFKVCNPNCFECCVSRRIAGACGRIIAVAHLFTLFYHAVLSYCGCSKIFVKMAQKSAWLRGKAQPQLSDPHKFQDSVYLYTFSNFRTVFSSIAIGWSSFQACSTTGFSQKSLDTSHCLVSIFTNRSSKSILSTFYLRNWRTNLLHFSQSCASSNHFTNYQPFSGGI